MKDMVLVIVEGGPKAQRRFKRLMLHRIKWEEDTAQGRKQDKIDKKNNEVDANKKMNSCQLIWEVRFTLDFSKSFLCPSVISQN